MQIPTNNKKALLTRFNNYDLYQTLVKRLPQLYRPQDAILHVIVAITLLAAFIIRCYNHVAHHFMTLNLPPIVVSAIPGLIIIWILGLFLYKRHPHVGLFLSSLGAVFLFILICSYALGSAITTPFPIIDPVLLKIDSVLGFSTTQVMASTYHYSWIVHFLNFCYNTWFIQLCLTPLLLAVYNNRTEIDRYMIATFFSFLIGGMIYYFWPTIAPAGVLHSPYFLPDQIALVTRFTEVHQHLPISVLEGGMIAFPSFHVINALLILYAWRRYPVVLIPLLIIDLGLITATLALGYHYLLDIVAAFVLAYFSIKSTNYVLKQFYPRQ